MPRAWEFQLPTKIHFGRGSIRKLGGIASDFGHSALLVGYADRAGLEPATERAESSLRKAGVAVTPFFEIPPDPEATLVEEGARRMGESGAGLVVALGGGSVIDAAKGIAAIHRMGGSLWDYTSANGKSKPITDAAPLIAIPTTAGTGSEVSAVAVFTHHGVASDPNTLLKASVSGPAVRPEVALIDPDLAVGSPPGLTAACGADALGHAIEACMSRRANPISSTLAGRAVGWIVEHLEAAVAEPENPVPREPLALAATLAGAAFTEAGVVVTHAIAQALGGVLHVPHGVGVAVGTPLTLRFNADSCVEVYCQLADSCGIQADTPKRQAERFVDRIVALLASIGLPDRIEPPDGPSDSSCDVEARDSLIDRLVRNAQESTPVPITLNPRKVDTAALRAMFEQIL